MKVCFIGLGSIGLRHMTDFQAIAEELGIEPVVHALRTGYNSDISSSFPSLKRVVHQFSDLDRFYDAVFITNPTHLHEETLREVVSLSQHIFVEKPVFHHSNVDMASLNIPPSSEIYVAAPLRFTGVYRKIKSMVTSERVLSARAISSSYLPDWRPTDYRQSYSASACCGGGVHLDLIHEWDYIIDLFGFPSECCKLGGKVSDLEIQSNDIALYIARSNDTFLEIHLDYFGRSPCRKLEIITPDRLITADFIGHSIRFSDSSPAIILNEDSNTMYLREMKAFLRMVLSGGENLNTITQAMKVLRVAEMNMADNNGDAR